MFSEKVGDLWVELQARHGNVAEALLNVQANLTATTKMAKAYQQVMGSPAGTDVLRAQATAYEAMKRSKLSEMQHESQFMATPEGQQRLQTDAQLSKMMQQAQAQQSWQKLVAEQGKSAAVLTLIRGKLGQVREGLAAVAGISPWGFGQAASWIERMAAAAGPMVWQTFTSSWTLLAAVIGGMFVPYIIKAAWWIQQTAFWIKSWSPATKEVVGGIIIWGGAILGVIGIMGTAISWIMRLIQALGLLRIAALLPRGLGLGALLAVATGAAIGVGATEAVRAVATQHSGGYQFQPVPTRAPEPGSDIQPSPRLSDAFIQRLFLTNPMSNLRSDTTAPHSWSDLGSFMIGGNAEQDRIRARARAEGRMPGGAAAGAARPGAPPGLLTDSNFQSQFFGIEEQFRRLQTAAASMSPLTAAITREQIGGDMQLFVRDPIVAAVDRNTEAVRANGPRGLA